MNSGKNRNWFGSTCVIVLLVAGVFCATASDALAQVPSRPSSVYDSKRPNIVVIMADDLGYSDLGCYGSEIQTPHLDRLAAEGMRFTQFYNCGRCCPTRASLLTGLYPHLTGVGDMMDDFRRDGYHGNLNQNCATIAELLHTVGYQTLMSGKWHVSRFIAPAGPKYNWPQQRGFDHFYGIIHGAASYFDPATLTLENQFIKATGYDYYLTDAIAERAAKMIEQAARSDKPFFLYVAFTGPHWPLHAPNTIISRYITKYAMGWDSIRMQRYRRQLASGIIKPGTPLSPRDSRVNSWETEPNQRWQARRMAVYAAQVDLVDQGVGRVLEGLRQAGADRNTLVLFLSDNGASAEEVASTWKGVHIPERSVSGRATMVGNSPKIMPGGPETYQSYGLGWAGVSNTPFRYYKQTVHEGGISTPFIAYWPSFIRRGQITDEVAHVIDIMPTCLDIAKARYPTSYGGHGLYPLSGRSLLPVLLGERREPIPYFWEHEGNCAVRRGNLKMVCKYPGGWELYDIVRDRSETMNLISKPQYRIIANEMDRMFREWGIAHKVEAWKGKATP